MIDSLYTYRSEALILHEMHCLLLDGNWNCFSKEQDESSRAQHAPHLLILLSQIKIRNNHAVTEADTHATTPIL